MINQPDSFFFFKKVSIEFDQFSLFCAIINFVDVDMRTLPNNINYKLSSQLLLILVFIVR